MVGELYEIFQIQYVDDIVGFIVYDWYLRYFVVEEQGYCFVGGGGCVYGDYFGVWYYYGVYELVGEVEY